MIKLQASTLLAVVGLLFLFALAAPQELRASAGGGTGVLPSASSHPVRELIGKTFDAGEKKKAGPSKKGGSEESPEKEKDAPDDSDPSKASKASKKLSIDEEYVRDRLQAFLHPTSMEFTEGGRVKLLFDFRKKDKDQEDSFLPKVSPNLSSFFRWTVRREEVYRYLPGNKTADPQIVGLKLSNAGTAFINCWFTDDIEAEVEYAQTVTFNSNQIMAVTYAGENDKAIGSNFGTQCGIYLKGKPAGGAGKAEPALYQNETKFKLLVRGGTFEAYRDGHQKQIMSYPQRGFESGRIGFVWGGGASGVINSLQIVGKLDLKKMVKEMQKAPRGR